MQHEANHTPNPDGTASLLVACLEHTWSTIRSRHPDVPDAVLVGGEGLQRGSLEVLGTLLHEAAHGLATARSVQDTSRGGRYHNRRYAQLARELGLDVAIVKPIGWSATTVPESTTAAYAGELEELRAALVLWRRHEHRIGSGTRSRNLLAATCGCGRRIRAAKATLAEAPIVCGLCVQPFEPEEAED